MLGDGTCDNERNIEPCGYDFSDCCSCDGSEEPCSSECMKSQCKYDETCSDQFLKDSTKYLQLIKSNFYYELGFTPCYNKDSNCDETKLREFYAGTGTDMTACTSLVCLFSENGGEVGVIQNSSGYLKVASSSRSTLEAEEQSSQLIAQSRSKVSQRWTSSRSLKELSSVSLKATSISTISDFNQTALYFSGVNSIKLSSTVIERGTAPTATALKVLNFKQASFDETTIRHNRATTENSGISISSLKSWGSVSSFNLTSSKFLNNSAPSIGCLYADVSSLFIEKSSFFNNSASSGSAGALELDCNEASPCNISLSSKNFTANSATVNGGAVYWLKKQPSFTTQLSSITQPTTARTSRPSASNWFLSTSGQLRRSSP
mmetsp:Transcript_20334/g.37968  ORF Transcript_20334/g.37968 Transcript_20334/m.37968 type:complete len:376 (-) Transcript_20334:2049-3176(-)